ncbi:MAG: LamG domain-containing protein [Brevinematales bacterium]|nr:LamG domain-containing protein [Brevinematales bacterium]
MKSFFYIFFIFLTGTSFLYSFKRFDTYKTFELKGSNWPVFISEGVSFKKDENGKIFIGLTENPDYDYFATDLFIDFEKSSLRLENYQTLYSYFILYKDEKFNGAFSGKFTFSDSCIKLLPKRESIFYPGSEVGSFTIDFWLYPFKNYDKQYIIYYLADDINIDNDRKYGFIVYLDKGRLKYKFLNFFYDYEKKNVIENVELEEEANVLLYKWEHHAISFDSRSGKMVIYRNGIEEKVIFITENFKKNGKVYYPYVNEVVNTPLIVGKNSFFLLDNLRISKKFINNFNLFSVNRKESFLITKVFKLADNFFSIKDIGIDLKKDDYGFVKFGYRISDDIFAPDNKNIPWVYVNLENFNIPEEFVKGKYIQFKLIIYPEVSEKDIKIYALKLNYNVDETPYIPQIVKAVPGDEVVEIYFIPSPEDDILGYEIYYGNESKNYISKDALEGASPIFIKKQSEGLQYHKATLTLKNERPYFISVRAVDKNGHKSPYSKEVYVRPSSVYSKNNFSIDR